MEILVHFITGNIASRICLKTTQPGFYDWCNKTKKARGVCGMTHIKVCSESVAHVVVAVSFRLNYLNVPLAYIRSYITVNKMC